MEAGGGVGAGNLDQIIGLVWCVELQEERRVLAFRHVGIIRASE